MIRKEITMTINNQLSIISENNHEYSANYDGNVSITSYSFDRNNENWETSIDYFSEILFMKLAEEFPSKRVYFWVKNIFCNVPSKIEKYKGIYNDKELLFLKTMANCNIFNHVTSEPYGFSALVEVKDS